MAGTLALGPVRWDELAPREAPPEAAASSSSVREAHYDHVGEVAAPISVVAAPISVVAPVLPQPHLLLAEPLPPMAREPGWE